MKTFKSMRTSIAMVIGLVGVAVSGCQSSHHENGKLSEGCLYNGATYSEGSHVCQAGREYVCQGTKWEPTNIKCDRGDGVLLQGTALAIMPDRILELSVGDSPASLVTGQTPKIMPCDNFFYVSNRRVGIRNNCGECKTAVVNWFGKGIKRYKVAAYGEIIIDILGQAQMIGEEPCS